MSKSATLPGNAIMDATMPKSGSKSEPSEKSKAIGVIGLGAMGGNMARVLHDNKYPLVLYDRNTEKYTQFNSMGNSFLARTIPDFVEEVHYSGSNATVLMMLPVGQAIAETIQELSTLMRKGDIIIDGSNNADYRQTVSNYEMLKQKGIYYLDVGVAGGPSDVLKGVTLMIGGDWKAAEICQPIFEALAGTGSFGYLGGSGSGHKLKTMVHNPMFYAHFAVAAEGASLVDAIKKEDPKFDSVEALRLLSRSPPITTGIMDAIYTAVVDEQLPPTAQTPKISTAVTQGITYAKEQYGMQLPIINGVLNGYDTMSDRAKMLFEGAKKLLTGH